MNSKRKKLRSTKKKGVKGEVEVKASLSRTRKIIARKFRNLHTNRLSDERKRDEKLVPVTDLLTKIVTQRDEINQNLEPNMQNNMNEDVGMEVDPNEFNDFGIPPPRYDRQPPPYDRPPPPYDPPAPPPPPRTPPAAQLPPIPPRPPSIHRNQPNIPSRRSSPATTPPLIPTLPISISHNRTPQVAETLRHNNNQMRHFFDTIIQNNNSNSRLNRKRSSIPTVDVDVFDTSNRKDDSKMRRQEVESLDLDDEEYNSDEGAVGGFDTGRSNSRNSRNVDDILTEEEEEEEDNDVTLNTDYYDESTTNENDVLRRKRLLTRHELQRKHDKAKNMSVVSPDDYDDFGLYRGPGVKRSKMEMDDRFIQKAIRRLKTRKLFEEMRNETHGLTNRELEQNFDRYTEYLKTASPEDFDDDGNFIGTLSRRRLLSTLVSKINSSKKLSRARKRDLKKGAAIEKSFIPYNQNIVYEYYDDPNELCDRLRLLLASKRAGNTNHDQEVNSIVEELRERGIIF